MNFLSCRFPKWVDTDENPKHQLSEQIVNLHSHVHKVEIFTLVTKIQSF